MSIATSLLGFLSACLGGVLIGIWNGFVLSIMWGWFVVPLGLPTITVPNAIGLALIVDLVRPYRKPDDHKAGDKAGWAKMIFTIGADRFLGALALLGVGYAVKGFM
jgi:hypothetical protein